MPGLVGLLKYKGSPCCLHRARHHSSGTGQHVRLALRMLSSDLGLSHGVCLDLGLNILLLASVWYPSMFLHYCGQWLFLQAIAVPVSRFQFLPYTVELVYQNSLLHTREELAVVVVGPLTLNVATLLLVLIRWGCQLIFGSFPSFLSKFIMALGVWTVFDPLAVFAVDAVLGQPLYKMYSAVSLSHMRGDPHVCLGLISSVFLQLFEILFICQQEMLNNFIFMRKFHNDGCVLDVFQRLHSKEGSFFVPQDLEVSNQELNYIVKKAEQWRGYSGERRKVAVYDYVWTEDTPSHHDTSSAHPPHGSRTPSTPGQGNTSTHISIYTLHPSGFREVHRHFQRQPSGAIVEVMGDRESLSLPQVAPAGVTHTAQAAVEGHKLHSTQQGCERRRKRTAWRSHRVEPAERSCGDPGAVPKPGSQ
ncbi:hypothetical protein GN956_G21705 [Arapaima gigas]